MFTSEQLAKQNTCSDALTFEKIHKTIKCYIIASDGILYNILKKDKLCGLSMIKEQIVIGIVITSA